jgi:hypothetical protein
MADNPHFENEESQVKRVLQKLQTFVKDSAAPMHLIFLLATAFEFGVLSTGRGIDRNRFASAVFYFLKKDLYPPVGGGNNRPLGAGAGQENSSNSSSSRINQRLFVCIDPNFTDENIGNVFKRLEHMVSNDINEIYEAQTTFKQLGGESITLKIRPPSENIVRFYSITFKSRHGLGEVIYHFCFLRYFIPQKRNPGQSLNFGHFIKNQINIQGVRGEDKRKRIQNYLAMDGCKYTSDSFYGALEALGKESNIQSIFLASALNSHDSPLGKNLDGISYMTNPRIRTNNSGNPVENPVLANRYFEDSCEVLSLLHNLYQARKPVFFLQLDSFFRVFAHQEVSERSKVPYIVPFDEDTQFFINYPPHFVEGNLSEYAVRSARQRAGKRNEKTRRYKRKNKKTRKQLY